MQELFDVDGRQSDTFYIAGLEKEATEVLKDLFEEHCKKFGVSQTTLFFMLLIQDMRTKYILDNDN